LTSIVAVMGAGATTAAGAGALAALVPALDAEL
jgi:hypothetical protein